MTTSVPSIEAHRATPLSVSDLTPAKGAFDDHDSMILALCDNRFIAEDVVSGDERFCHQLRHATNADTVYLCCRNRLSVTATTSATNDVTNEDTQAIHNALLSMVADPGSCRSAVQLPELSVFPDHAKLCVSIVPVSALTLAIIVDADKPWRQLTEYCAEAIAAVYRCQTAAEHEGFAPTLQQIHKFVFDALNRRYQPASPLIDAKRFDIFMDDLTALDVTFDKLIEPQPTGSPIHWGFEAVPLHPSSQLSIKKLLLTAAERNANYQTQIDLCLLKKAAYGYKAHCESAALLRVSDIKPICIAVSLQSLRQELYITALRELIEKCVIAGSKLVFEVRDTQVRAESSTPGPATLEQIVTCLRDLRCELGIRVMLSDKALINASLTTLMALEPEFLKFNHIVSKAGVQPVGAMLEEFSLLAATGMADNGNTHRQVDHHLASDSNASKPTETANEAVTD